jgi:hypothetical protein
LRPRAEEVIAHVHAHYQRRQQLLDAAPPESTIAKPPHASVVDVSRSGWSYDDADLDVLFGGSAQ